MAARKHIKMSDIAKELGISTVAVSKALSGQKGVSEELRARSSSLTPFWPDSALDTATVEMPSSFAISDILMCFLAATGCLLYRYRMPISVSSPVSIECSVM